MFAKTLQYSYLFGILPALMIGAVDDILSTSEEFAPVVRMLIVGAIAFVAAELLYGSRGPDSGALQFVLYGLVGFVPATVSSWLSHMKRSTVRAYRRGGLRRPMRTSQRRRIAAYACRAAL